MQDTEMLYRDTTWYVVNLTQDTEMHFGILHQENDLPSCISVLCNKITTLQLDQIYQVYGLLVFLPYYMYVDLSRCKTFPSYFLITGIRLHEIQYIVFLSQKIYFMRYNKFRLVFLSLKVDFRTYQYFFVLSSSPKIQLDKISDAVFSSSCL